ncbi:spore germination protein [Paenibacillus filicis]|uniref:Spore germination protein n=1 Tax=Paenibacillus gyeongsangnamensis TaxID=3388067 RepID=A0ABT4QEL4_9BACL|nr:spore germination protein [Paenibacillus filicis]MCZ8515321.1 spore germination protein [Paenibacillus filicis]
MSLISRDIEWNATYLREQFSLCSDIVIRSFILGDETKLILVYLDGMTRLQSIEDNLLKPLIFICLFILSYGLSEWTGFKNRKIIAWLITFALLAYVFYITHNIRIANTLKTQFLFASFIPFVYVVIPLILWVISSVRKNRKTSLLN